jgi:hypothetical protein
MIAAEGSAARGGAPPIVPLEPAPWRRPIDFPAPWDELTAALPGEVPAEPTLTMACLGRQGAWGNTLLQYAFLRCFAATHGFHCQVPRWIGSSLLAAHDPELGFRAPVIVADGFSAHCAAFDRQAPFDRDLLRARHVAATGGRRYLLLERPSLAGGGIRWPFRHADLEGFFFAHGRELAPHRELIRSLFRPAPAIAERAGAAVARLRAGARTLVGIHVRRSDFLTLGLQQGFELLTPIAVYREWLEALWPTLDQPRLVICTDSPGEVLPAFSRYQPATAESLGLDLSDLLAGDDHAWSRGDFGVARAPGFFGDWLLLTQCDVLATSNSTFSYSACLANERARRCVRPTFPDGRLVPFDPWDSEPLLLLSAPGSLPGLAELRLRLTARGLRGQPARYAWRSLLRILGDYPRILRWRAATCLRVHGPLRLLRELLSPGFYWRTERRYMGPKRGAGAI